MANYIVSYDLNGSTPTHKQMDAHIAKKAGWTRGRVLETVWYRHSGQPGRRLQPHQRDPELKRPLAGGDREERAVARSAHRGHQPAESVDCELIGLNHCPP